MLVTLLSLTAITFYASKSLRQFYLDQTKNSLFARACFFAPKATSMIEEHKYKEINLLAKKLGTQTKSRVTVILPSGQVVADSNEDPALMENHADRPELKTALTNDYGSSIRYSSTLDYNMMYVAIELQSNGNVIGFLRTSVSVKAIKRTLTDIFFKLIFFGLIIAVLSALICWIASKRITKPIENIRKGAEKFAQGNFCHRIIPSNIAELKNLSISLNNMAEQLDNRIKTIIEHRKEIDTILSSMVEGILVVRTNERIITINASAAAVINVNPDEVKNKLVQEIIRNTQIQGFVKDALRTEKSLEQKVVLTNEKKIILRGYANSLYDSENKKIGVLIVLKDITKLYMLENHRREFVTNVSHEIKTPLTLIKGFVETLKDGGLKNHNHRDAKRFLNIIEKQANRLNTLVDDLLMLSKIENDAEKKFISRSAGNIAEVLKSAISLCGIKAKKKNIKLFLKTDENISCSINSLLLEQVFVNLIDNAVKYSPQGSIVNIQTTVNEFEILIHIKDQGCGIENEHIPRLFERFYRVDKARSREEGGTGLGLSIVKFIMSAHNGHVTVQSKPAKGSVFTVHLPNIYN